MDTVDAMKTASPLEKRTGILYPVMLIAAIALIVLSVAGIATMMGWMPSALSDSDPAAKASCVNCGVVESISVKYPIRVRMSDGSRRTSYQRTQPALSVGQKVRVTEQAVVTAG